MAPELTAMMAAHTKRKFLFDRRPLTIVGDVAEYKGWYRLYPSTKPTSREWLADPNCREVFEYTSAEVVMHTTGKDWSLAFV